MNYPDGFPGLSAGDLDATYKLLEIDPLMGDAKNRILKIVSERAKEAAWMAILRLVGELDQAVLDKRNPSEVIDDYRARLLMELSHPCPGDQK